MIWPSVHPGLVVKSTLFISNPMAATLKGLSDAVGVRGNGSKGVRQNAGPCSCLCYCNCMKTIRKVIEEDNNSACRQLLFAMMHEATKEKNASASDVCALFMALLLYNSQDLLHKISFKLCSTVLFSLPSCFVFFFFFFMCCCSVWNPVLLLTTSPRPSAATTSSRGTVGVGGVDQNDRVENHTNCTDIKIRMWRKTMRMAAVGKRCKQ